MPRLIPLRLSAPSRPLLKVMSPWSLLAANDEYLGLGKLQEVDGARTWLMQDGRTLPFEAVTHWAALVKPQMFADGTDDSEVLDAEGYPTESALRRLELWPWYDPQGALEFMSRLWTFPERARQLPAEEGEKVSYGFSTGGWSGNEALIAAVQRNAVVWGMTWAHSERGGFHRFSIRD